MAEGTPQSGGDFVINVAASKTSLDAFRKSIEGSIKGLTIKADASSLKTLKSEIEKSVMPKLSFGVSGNSLKKLNRDIHAGIGLVPIQVKVDPTSVSRAKSQIQNNLGTFDVQFKAAGFRRLSSALNKFKVGNIAFTKANADDYRNKVQGYFAKRPIKIATQLRAPSGQAARAQINTQGIQQNAKTQVAQANAVKGTNKQLEQYITLTSRASAETFSFAERIGFTTSRLSAYLIPAATIFQLARAFEFARTAILDINADINRLTQIFEGNSARASKLAGDILGIAERYGQSGRELLKVTLTLAQAGQQFQSDSALKRITNALAQTQVAATFGDLENTTEGVIASLNQFNLVGDETIRVLDVANELSKEFAFEADNLFTAVRSGGAAFSAAGGSFEEFASAVAALRQITRLSPATIGTGLNTIALRLLRPDIVKFVDDLTGGNIRDAQGNLKGINEILVEIGKATKDLSNEELGPIIERLSGIRQGKLLIPLLRDIGRGPEESIFLQAQTKASISPGSLGRDAAKGLERLDVQLKSISTRFEEVFKKISEDKAFQSLIRDIVTLSKSLADLLGVLGPLIPTLIKFGGIKLGVGIISGANDFLRGASNFRPGPFDPGSAASVTFPGRGPISGNKPALSIAAGGRVIQGSGANRFYLQNAGNTYRGYYTPSGRLKLQSTPLNPNSIEAQLANRGYPQGSIPEELTRSRLESQKLLSNSGRASKSLNLEKKILTNQAAGNKVSQAANQRALQQLAIDTKLVNNKIAASRYNLSSIRSQFRNAQTTAEQTRAADIANQLFSSSRKAQRVGANIPISAANLKQVISPQTLIRAITFGEVSGVQNLSPRIANKARRMTARYGNDISMPLAFLASKGININRDIQSAANPYELSGAARLQGKALARGEAISNAPAYINQLKTVRFNLLQQYKAEIKTLQGLQASQIQLKNQTVQNGLARGQLQQREKELAAALAAQRTRIASLNFAIRAAQDRLSFRGRVGAVTSAIGTRISAGFGRAREQFGRAFSAGGADRLAEAGGFALGYALDRSAARTEAGIRNITNNDGDLLSDAEINQIITANQRRIVRASALRNASSGLITGTIIGAQLGTAILPGLGTVIGAGAGAIAGGIGGTIVGNQSGRSDAAIASIGSRFIAASLKKDAQDFSKQIQASGEEFDKAIFGADTSKITFGNFVRSIPTGLGVLFGEIGKSAIGESNLNLSSATKRLVTSGVEDIIARPETSALAERLRANLLDEARTSSVTGSTILSNAQQRITSDLLAGGADFRIAYEFAKQLIGSFGDLEKQLDQARETTKQFKNALAEAIKGATISLRTLADRFDLATNYLLVGVSNANIRNTLSGQATDIAFGGGGFIGVPSGLSDNVVRNIANIINDKSGVASTVVKEQLGGILGSQTNFVSDLASIQKYLTTAGQSVQNALATKGINAGSSPEEIQRAIGLVVNELLPNNLSLDTKEAKDEFGRIRQDLIDQLESDISGFVNNPTAAIEKSLRGINVLELITNRLNVAFAELNAEVEASNIVYRQRRGIEERVLEIQSRSLGINLGRIDQTRALGASDADVLRSLDTVVRDNQFGGFDGIPGRIDSAQSRLLAATTGLTSNPKDYATSIREIISANIELLNANNALKDGFTRSANSLTAIRAKFDELSRQIGSFIEAIQKSAVTPVRERNLAQFRTTGFNNLFGDALTNSPIAGATNARSALNILSKLPPEEVTKLLQSLPNVGGTELLNQLIGGKNTFGGSISGLSRPGQFRTNAGEVDIVTFLLGLRDQLGNGTPERVVELMRGLNASFDQGKTIEEQQLDALKTIANLLSRNFGVTAPFPGTPNTPATNPDQTNKLLTDTIARLNNALEGFNKGGAANSREVIDAINALKGAISNREIKVDVDSNINIIGFENVGKDVAAKAIIIGVIQKIMDQLDRSNPSEADLWEKFNNVMRQLKS